MKNFYHKLQMKKIQKGRYIVYDEYLRKKKKKAKICFLFYKYKNIQNLFF